MLSLLIALYSISPVFSACDYTSKWKINGNTLDLSAFQAMGLNISGTDTQYSYRFSPTNNLIHSLMLKQYSNVTYNTLGYQLTLKDVEPTISFNKFNNIVWNFEYSSNISIQYICDPQSSTDPPYMKFTNILEILPGKYIFQISSSYFCSDNIAPHSLGANQCVWTDPSNLYTLNLTSLYGKEISITNTRQYSVCSDLIYVPDTYPDYPACCMLGHNLYPDYDIYSFWDPNVNPVHNITDNSWTFKYKDVSLNGGYQSIVWMCDPAADPYYVIESYNKFTLITSKYVCNEACHFVSNDGKYNLDLHSLSGNTIYGTSDDLKYSIQYSPCSNYIQCNSKEVMAMRWDVQNRDCNPYLAVFEGNNFDGYNLTYDASLQQWHFIYFNGELCSRDASNDVFHIYWTCNETVSDWYVTEIETINDCEYGMYIQTKHTC